MRRRFDHDPTTIMGIATVLGAAAIIIMVIVAILGTAGNAAQAQTSCDAHSTMVEKLEGNYQEVQAGLGLATNGALVQLYVSESGSWTMLLTNARGVACLIAAGHNWEIVKPDYPADRPET